MIIFNKKVKYIIENQDCYWGWVRWKGSCFKRSTRGDYTRKRFTRKFFEMEG